MRKYLLSLHLGLVQVQMEYIYEAIRDDYPWKQLSEIINDQRDKFYDFATYNTTYNLHIDLLNKLYLYMK